MGGEDLAFMKSHIGRMNRLFRVLIAAVTVLEFMLMLRGIFFFDLERLELRLYLYSYVFLFTVSLAMLIVLWVFGNQEAHFHKVLTGIYVYAFCFMMWSAGIACIDCYAQGDSGITVYVLTCISVGVLTLLKPRVFFCYLITTSVFLLTATYCIREGELYSYGFYLNYGTFLAMAIFVNSQNYNLSLREFHARKTLERHADTDPLTGLYNRRRLDEQMRECRRQEPFVLVMLDIDGFKQVNDSFGHPVGDTCLEKLAQILTAHFGSQVYRMGGDEFAVISCVDVPQTCERIDAVNRELGRSMADYSMRISAGIYLCRESDTQQAAFRRADDALYRAKRTGGAAWAVYEEGEAASA